MLSLLTASPLFELINRANLRILLGLNHFFAAHPKYYSVALFLTETGTVLLVLGTMLLLWFWLEPERGRSLFSTSSIEAPLRRSAIREFLQGFAREDENATIVTREESRAQVLLLAFGILLAFVINRIVALGLDIREPFTSYWMVKPPNSLTYLFDGMRRSDSFSGGQAAIMAGFAVALFFWNQRLGWMGVVAATVLCLCRVAVGFQYPMDMLAGAIIGASVVWLLLRAYRQRGDLFRRSNALAQTFQLSNAPYCYLLYFIAFLLGIEFFQQFEHVQNLIFALRSEILQGMGRGT